MVIEGETFVDESSMTGESKMIHKKVGDYVRKGESLARLYANDLAKLKAASPRLFAAYKLSKERVEAPKHVLGIVTKDGCTRF